MSVAGGLQSGPNVIAVEGPQLGLPRPSSSEPRRSERNSPLRCEGNIQFCKNSHGGCMRCRPFGRRAHLQRRLWGLRLQSPQAQYSWRVRKFRPKENDTQIVVEITKRSRSRSTLCRGLCSAVSTNLHPRRRGEYRRDDGEKKDDTPANPAICKGPHHGLTRLCLRRLKGGSPQPHRRAMKSPGGAGNAGQG